MLIIIEIVTIEIQVELDHSDGKQVQIKRQGLCGFLFQKLFKHINSYLGEIFIGSILQWKKQNYRLFRLKVIRTMPET